MEIQELSFPLKNREVILMCGSTRIRVAVILFLLISHLLLMRDDTIMAVPLRPAQDSEAVQILFLDGNKRELPVQGHATIKASVYDARGNRLNNADIEWQLADPDNEAFVLVGRNVKKDGVNSVDLTWLGGRADLKLPTDIKLIARSGPTARGVVTIEYKAPVPETVKLSVESKQIVIQPGQSKDVE